MRPYPLPSHEDCRDLIRQCHLPTHIRKHSEAVARMGVFLARRLVEKGIAVDIDLVERACLLHDLFRVCDFPLEDFRPFEQPVTEADKAKWRRLKTEHGHRRHEDAAHAFLKERYPVLAETIRKHRYVAVLPEEDGLDSWEEKIVYYADKRAMHDTIVPLKQRLDDAHRRSALVLAKAGKRYDPEMEARVDALIFRLEEELFSRLDIKPDEVTEELIARTSEEEAA